MVKIELNKKWFNNCNNNKIWILFVRMNWRLFELEEREDKRRWEIILLECRVRFEIERRIRVRRFEVISFREWLFLKGEIFEVKLC